ncbi:DUF4192 family protein [Microbacterium sp.]|uniref:DUF4192 family protein n=1 Tax=Microbacterium sp. TaxID=51671 RepID=UPI00334160F0
MTTILRASEPAELLSHVPALAGCVPRRSLVLLPFSGRRASGAMRVDLPADDTELGAYVDGVTTVLLRVPELDAVAVVVYCDETATETRDGLVLPLEVMVDELIGTISDAGLRLADALCVTGDGWADYLADEPVLRPLGEIAPTPPPGSTIDEDQLSGAVLPPSTKEDRGRVRRAMRDLDAVLDDRAPGPSRPVVPKNPQALAAAVMLDDVPQLAEDVLMRPEALPPFACAALLLCLERPALRDAILVQWASGLQLGRDALDDQGRHLRTGGMPTAAVGDVFLGRGPRPDPDRLRRALQAVRLAASLAPRRGRPGPLVAAAWLSWAAGRSSHAGEYLRMAQEIEPQHRMAALLQSMLAALVLPEWTLRQPSAGQGAT